MPPAFIVCSSRSSSSGSTAGPNHHQRIIGRASAGGAANPRRRATSESPDVASEACASLPRWQKAAGTSVRQAATTQPMIRRKPVMGKKNLDSGPSYADRVREREVQTTLPERDDASGRLDDGRSVACLDCDFLAGDVSVADRQAVLGLDPD